MGTPSLSSQSILSLACVAIMVLSGTPGHTDAVAAPPPTPGAPTATPDACSTGRTIQVSGAAVVNVIPDQILLQLGVQSNGVTVNEVERANTAAIQSLMRALRAQGVAEKDIATDWYVIEPLYDDYDSLHIKGYRIDNIVAVTLRSGDRVSPVIGAALKAGANRVVNIEFYTSRLRAYRDQARELAMKAAGEKAQALAGAAGARAGCVMSISENSWSTFNSWWAGRTQSLWAQNVVQVAGPAAGDSGTSDDGPISLGELSVRAEVSVVYSLN